MSDKCLFFGGGFLRAKKEIEYGDFMFLLTGGVGLQNNVPNPDPHWLQDKSWDEICRASHLPNLQGLKYDIDKLLSLPLFVLGIRDLFSILFLLILKYGICGPSL